MDEDYYRNKVINPLYIEYRQREILVEIYLS